MFENIFDLTNMYFRETMIMFTINLVFLFILIRAVYFRYCDKATFVFAFFLIGIIVFFIGSILNAIQMQVELAVGLVAIFTILRLRTRSITIKDMAYIFAVIGISVINSLRLVAFPLAGRLIINIIIIVTAIILEKYLRKIRLVSADITYENIDLLKPERRQELLADLSSLTGRNIVKVSINNIDFIKRSAEIVVYFREEHGQFTGCPL